DGIRDRTVTGVQTCTLPISTRWTSKISMSDIAAANQHPVNIEDEMKRSYMDYAMSVIIGRALPDARDGLKPAHRRVIYGMKTMRSEERRVGKECKGRR